MNEKQRLYVRSRMTHWDNLGIKGIPALDELLTAAPELGDGFMPVFKTLEAFKKAYPGEAPLIAEVVASRAEGGDEQ